MITKGSGSRVLKEFPLLSVLDTTPRLDDHIYNNHFRNERKI